MDSNECELHAIVEGIIMADNYLSLWSDWNQTTLPDGIVIYWDSQNSLDKIEATLNNCQTQDFHQSHCLRKDLNTTSKP